jgi:F-type H+-transporting ATPase subunit epsilon
VAEAREGRQLFCRLITPERVVFDEQANMVVARIADGEIGILADHQPTVSTVEVGAVRITQGNERRVFATSDGFFKVSENLVQVLVEEAVPADEIDTAGAQDRVEEAERELGRLSGEEDVELRREELERRRKMGENLMRVAREYGDGQRTG